jgi:hypothetical protein
MRRAELERSNQRRQAVGVVRQAETFRQIRGAARPGFVPGDDGELVAQAGKLRLPETTVRGSTVHQHQRRALADSLVGYLQPARPDDLHRRDLRAHV